MRFFGMMWNIAKIKLRKQKINTLRREESLSISRTFSFFLQMKPVSLCPCSCPCSFLHFRMQTPCFLDSTSTTVEQQKQKIQQENSMDILYQIQSKNWLVSKRTEKAPYFPPSQFPNVYKMRRHFETSISFISKSIKPQGEEMTLKVR